jgi:hypothetical protein
MMKICELCGEKAEELRMLFLDDFAGRVCPECVSELWNSQARLFCGTVEETEQSE